MKTLFTFFFLIVAFLCRAQRGHVIMGSARSADTNNVRAAVTVFDSTVRLLRYSADGTMALFTTANGSLFLAKVITPAILDDTAWAIRQHIPDTALLKFKRDSVNANGYTTLYRNGLKLNAADTANNVATKSFLLANYHKQGGGAFGAEQVFGSTDNNRLAWWVNNTRRATMFTNGNLQIGSGTTDNGYKLDVQGTVRGTGLVQSTGTSASDGLGCEWNAKMGFRNGAQGWRIRFYGVDQLLVLQDEIRGGSPISGISGLRFTFSSDNSVSLGNVYNMGVLRKLTIGMDGSGGGTASVDGIISSGEHSGSNTNMPGSDLFIRGGCGTGNSHGGIGTTDNRAGRTYIQAADTVASGIGAQTYTDRIVVWREGTTISHGTATVPHQSSVLEVQSSSAFAVPVPIMTLAQRDAVSAKKPGHTVFCTDCLANDTSIGVTQTWNGTEWKSYW